MAESLGYSEEVPKPQQYTTYQPHVLYLAVFRKNKKGSPISYKKISRQSYSQLGKIKEAVTTFYTSSYHEVEDVQKLHLTRLSALTGLGIGRLSHLVLLGASWIELRQRGVDMEWIVKFNEPLWLFQQAAKHIQRILQ